MLQNTLRGSASQVLDHPLDERIVNGLGAVTWSGYGDGGYPVFVGRHAGKVAKIRISFIDDQPEIDRLVASTGGPTKAYRASVEFKVGDAIEHPKFGVGSVVRAGGGKIDVAFADGLRTLVHGRK